MASLNKLGEINQQIIHLTLLLESTLLVHVLQMLKNFDL